MPTSDFSASDLVGSVIDGRFELHEKLGEGGMGVIYKARQLSMERMVAVKILLRNRRGDAISVERFRHEAYLASRLRHPNAVVIYDFGQSAGDGLLYIAMELLAGENLKQRIQRVPQQSVGTAVRILRQTLRPISQAHRMGLIHRDLKPANIFLTTVEGDPDFVKVLDFGVAKLTAVHDGLSEGYQGGLTVAGKIYGTPNYMSPEQIRGKDLDHHSDLYSLGIIFYEMLCGRRPFEADTPVDVMMMHLRDAPPPVTDFRSDIPPGLMDVVRRSLAKDPAQRFTNGEEFLEALEPFRNSSSAEFQAWPGDPNSGGPQGVQSPEPGSSPSVSVAPILSGIGLDDFDDDDGFIGDDLADEKTMLDDSVLEVSAADAIEAHEPNTVFESDIDGELANAFNVMESAEAEAPLLGPPATQRDVVHTDGPTEMSVLELRSGDFESMDPSRLIDIPKLDDEPASAPSAPKPASPRLTFEGHPGISAVSQPQAPEPRAVEEEEPDLSAGARRRQLASLAPPTQQSESRGAPIRSGATAFQVPRQGAPTVPSAGPERPNIWLKVLAGAVLLAALAVGALLLLPKLMKPSAPPKPPKLVLMSQPGGLEIFLDGRYLGATPVEHELKQASAGHALMLTKGSKRYTAKLGAISEPSAVFVDVAEGSPNGALASAQIVTEPPGLPVKIKEKKIGTSPLTLLGVKGQQWVLTVGPPGATQAAKVKAANGEPVRLTFDPKEGG